MRISESLALTTHNELTLQNALEWLTKNYSPATRGIHLQTDLYQNSVENTATMILTVHSIKHSWSKQVDLVIATNTPLNKQSVYLELERSLVSVLPSRATRQT